MGNHWALCTTWFPLCFPSISQQQNCFYSRHPGFHQRVRLAGKKYNGSSPNWPHLLIHNRPGMNTLLQSLSRMQKGCMGEIQQLWEVPSDLHKISKVPDWHMMKCLVFSILSHTFTENISEKLSREGWADDELGEICTIDHSDRVKKNISVIPWIDSCLIYVCPNS